MGTPLQALDYSEIELNRQFNSSSDLYDTANQIFCDDGDSVMTEKVPIWVTEPAYLNFAQELVQKTGLELISKPKPHHRLVLRLNSTLELVDCTQPRLLPITIKWQTNHRLQNESNLLCRAMGKKLDRVIDATAGYGKDCWQLCQHGFRVLAIERNPVIFALLYAARSQQPVVSARNIDILHADSQVHLQKPQQESVIYLDPMYSRTMKQTVLNKRPMRVLNQLVGSDSDAERLFAVAWHCSTYRLVVKRHPHAKPLQPRPCFSLSGKLVRFDVYTPSWNKSG